MNIEGNGLTARKITFGDSFGFWRCFVECPFKRSRLESLLKVPDVGRRNDDYYCWRTENGMCDTEVRKRKRRNGERSRMPGDLSDFTDMLTSFNVAPKAHWAAGDE